MKALIIQDDDEIARDVSMALEIRWPDVDLGSTCLGKKGAALATSGNPDLAILDLDLPDTTGFSVIKRIRAVSNVPILVLTARSGDASLVKALEWGADDYMTKPFRQLEFLSRVGALIRRSSFTIPETLVHGDLSFTPYTGRLCRGRTETTLTRTEGYLLAPVSWEMEISYPPTPISRRRCGARAARGPSSS